MTILRTPGVALVALAGVLLEAMPAAQQSSVTSAAGTSRVSIDFRVTSNAGGPISDLQPSEILLKVAGRERQIESLEFVAYSRTAERSDAPASASALPPPFAVTSDRAGRPIRRFLILVDEVSVQFGAEARLRESVSRLLAAIPPHDLVGLMTLGTTNAEIGFTDRHGTIQAAVDALVGGRAPSGPCHNRALLQLLQTAVTRIPQGMSSTVLFFAGSSLTPPTPPISTTGGQRGMSQSCAVLRSEIGALERAVTRTQANVYVQGLRDLPGAIGAEPAILAGGDGSTIERIVRETGSHYRATFVSGAERADDLHRVELRVARPNVRVRAPSRIAIPLVAATGLSDVAPARTLALRVTAVPAQHAPGKVKLLAIFEPVDERAIVTEAIVAAVDEQGQTAAQVTLRPAELRQRPIVSALPVPPGIYRIRISAADSAGRRGLVEDSVRAGFTYAGAMMVSGLLFGVIEDGAFAPRLQFGSEGRATAYLEVYGVESGTPIAVTFELADGLDAPARATIAGTIQPGQPGTRLVTADIPLETMPPGDVLVRAVISVDDAAAGRVFRTLRRVR